MTLKEDDPKGTEVDSLLAKSNSSRVNGWLRGSAVFASLATLHIGRFAVGTLVNKSLYTVLPFLPPPSPALLGFRGVLQTIGAGPLWQVGHAASFALNFWAVSKGGRIDSRYQKTGGVPQEDEYRGLVTPAGWAFAIWGVIYMGEMAMTGYMVSPAAAVAPSPSGWLGRLAPHLMAAHACQAVWCAAFRDWARPAHLFWLSATSLSSIALCLNNVHMVLASVRNMTTAQYCMVHLPATIHFGWVTAASLVNWNSYLALLRKDGYISVTTQIFLANLSVQIAILIGMGVSWYRSDPVYGLTLAWALAAVCSDGGKRAHKSIPPESAGALAKMSGLGSMLCAGTSFMIMTGLVGRRQ
mmetsp:Transcript_28054/g.38785  ORF Transcript_28054/g.38785 Transcript_28054/m.38785 type:complete len:355 (-) Transcript_28054:284-1348(-)